MGRTISQLDAAGPLTGGEKIPMVQGGRTVWAQPTAFSPLLDSGCKCTLVSRMNSVPAPDVVFEEYLQTYQMPVNTLRSVGDWIEIISFGSFGVNSNAKNIFHEIKGGAVYHDFTTAGSASDTVWELKSILTKTSSSDIKVITSCLVGGTALSSGTTSNNYTRATVLTTLEIDISMGSYGLTAASDVICEGFIVRLNQVDTNS